MTSLAQRLADALIALTPDHPEAIERLRDHYDPSMVFRDPIQEVHGIEAFLAMNLLASVRSAPTCRPLRRHERITSR
jgi:hypothetical protein